ncbi:CLUMA_CG008602, isoform A, partial [Clunio marinus]
MVIIAFIKQKKLQSSTNNFIVSLAAADTMDSIILVAFKLIYNTKIFSRNFCYLAMSIFGTSEVVISMTLLLLAILLFYGKTSNKFSLTSIFIFWTIA